MAARDIHGVDAPWEDFRVVQQVPMAAPMPMQAAPQQVGAQTDNRPISKFQVRWT